ncbi:hypothetical protein, partial [Escherichia coli]|uniref:hypothetical protein n=1 Tax=Escherichia coli TaxID=562 RepID=UPI00390B5EDC
SPVTCAQKKAFFRARTDPRRIQTPHGPEGQKVVQKNCANLCTIVHCALVINKQKKSRYCGSI